MHINKSGLVKSVLNSLLFTLLIFSLTSCYSIQSIFEKKISEKWLGYYLYLETNPKEVTYGTATVLLLKKSNDGGFVIQKITSHEIFADELKVSVTDSYLDEYYYASIQVPSEDYPDSIKLNKGYRLPPSHFTELLNLQETDKSVPYMEVNPSSFNTIYYFKISGIETPEDIKNLEASFIAKEKEKEAEYQSHLEKVISDYLESNNKSKKFLISLLGNKKMYFIPQTSEFGWNGPQLFESEILADGETIKFTSLSKNPYLSGRIFLLSWNSDGLSDSAEIWQYFRENKDKQDLIKFNPIVDYDLGGQWLLRIRNEILPDLKKVLDMYGLESEYSIYLKTYELFAGVYLYIVLEDE